MSIVPREDSGDEGDDFSEMPDSGFLPPDHPMMVRFQQALEEHLLKVQGQLQGELDELDEQLKLKDAEIAETGAKLFDMNNELEKQRDQIDQYSRNLLDVSAKRKVHEEKAAKFKAEYTAEDLSCKEMKRLNNEMLQEITSMRVLESEISKWNEEIQNEIALARRVATKDKKDQKSASEEKKQMDVILFKLDSEVRKNEREISNIEDQIQEHTSSVTSLNQSLANANVDLEGLQHEHKKLMQAWGEVIVSVQHRDKVLAKARTELL